MKSTAEQVAEALASLERQGTKRVREDMLTRYGITAPKAYGVPMSAIQRLGKQLGRDHELAAALWATGWYEARTLAALVEEPAGVTAAQMDRWARDFDNWAICDTVCFHLFDRTPYPWTKVAPWSKRREEFVKRAAFALLASLAAHDRSADDEQFLRRLPLVECAAVDERNFVKKGVSWALRMMGRRSRALNAACLASARRLVASDQPAARWIGRQAEKELAGVRRGSAAAPAR
jgi:3-methyladenine DNA glycosylase AlkD